MKTFWTGMVLTIVYFIALGLTTQYLHLQLMTTWNEFGDFLAGAFSPVAFLWLVLGYLQQQKELQQNTKALELQAVELKNSVDQYKDMVDVARQQLVADRDLSQQQNELRELENKPDISLAQTGYSMKSGNDIQYRWFLHNDGREARNVIIQCSPVLGNLDNQVYKKIIDARHQLPINAVKRTEMPREVAVTISYESIFGKKYVKVIDLKADDNDSFVILKETIL